MRITVDEALSLIENALCPVTGYVQKSFSDSVGNILAQPVVAQRNNPSVNNSAMDGYAFRWASLEQNSHLDIESRRSLKILNGVQAKPGFPPVTAPLGYAVRIFTGAPMPDDTDTVIQQEYVTVQEGKLHFPDETVALWHGMNCRLKGEDFTIGQALMAEGTRVLPHHIGLGHLAGIGKTSVMLRVPLVASVLSTGDELTRQSLPDENSAEHTVCDCNAPMLMSWCKLLGVQTIDCGIISDHPDDVLQAIDYASEFSDCIVISGGASVGDRDYITTVISDTGELRLEGVAMKPGGPFAWGFWKGKPVFCLPGNPVACFVTFAIFVRPAIMRLSGMDWRTDQRYNLPIAFDYPKKKGRREFVRVAVNPVTMMLEKVASQGSGIVTGLSLSHGLADFAETIAFAKTGDSIPFMPFSSLGLF